jgi:hypothetical protein
MAGSRVATTIVGSGADAEANETGERGEPDEDMQRAPSLGAISQA